jgi:DNA-binding NarL/FixJ family response regulator
MIKVVIYENNLQLREGLTMLVNGSDEFEVLATFKNCSNVLSEIKAYRPDVS